MRDVLKRAVDVIISAVALMILFPFLLLLALSIRLDSPGRVFFLQRRIGRDMREFRVVKFRTMIDRDPDRIDQHAEQVVSKGHDPRITRSGRILRKTSLDELPQLWNIIVGDMSLVGPRPVLPEQVEVVPPEYMARFDVRPGLTGLAQVRGRRSLGWLEQIHADSEYAARHSFWLDLKIILRTFVVIFNTSEVYGDESKNWRSYQRSIRSDQCTNTKASIGDRDEEI
jgi:lipopolysaccharide/colanic/teichoic acid biosynthesis glycosyltransferase